MRKLWVLVLGFLLLSSSTAFAEGNAFRKAGQLIGEQASVMTATISGNILYILDDESRLFGWDGQAEKASLLAENTDASNLIGGDVLLVWGRDGSRSACI